MLNELKRVYENKIDAALYTNREDMKHFAYGRILAMNEGYIAIKRLSLDGTDDGIVVGHTDNIFRVETENQYTEKMAKLQALSNQEPEHYDIDNQNIRETLLSAAQHLKKVVSLELLDSGNYDVVGFVEQIQTDLCKIRQIDEYGYEDGVSYVRIQDITEISCDSEDEKIVLSLFKCNEEDK